MIYRSDTRSVLEPSASVEKPSVDKNVKPQKDPTSNTLVVDNSLMQAEQATVKTKSNSIIIPNSKELGRQNNIKTIKYNTVSYVPKKEVSQTTIVNSSNNNNNNNIIQPHCMIICINVGTYLKLIICVTNQNRYKWRRSVLYILYCYRYIRVMFVVFLFCM